MLGLTSKNANAGAILKALDNSLAIIEFDVTGNILSANGNFCAAVGYPADEIIGKHHRIFVGDKTANSTEYQSFWSELASGEFKSGEFQRFTKTGAEIWIQATYNPVLDGRGNVTKVIKFASDITKQKLATTEYENKVEAISRSQAVIEFEPDGTILTANENFCSALGYSLSEIEGRKHAMFVAPDYAAGAEYREFWNTLRSGTFLSDQFKRFGKGNKEVWIQASYNPIFDMSGNVVKVVKYATDITDRIIAVNKIGDALKKLAVGELDVRIDEKFPTDLEALRNDLNSSIKQLAETFTNLKSTTESVGTGIREIVTASDDLSVRTEKQAASLEEAASTLGQITNTVQQSAESAENTQQVVEAAKNDAQSSGEIVEKALSAMTEIETSASEINKIISVIDEIAFQTNLLALNAGVEAARAGDAGQGFAVVASEVRALAQRSAEAAKEIKTLISKSSDQVISGSKLVGEAGTTMQKIATQVVQISSVVSEISEGAKSQFASLNDLNAMVKELDTSTQQNAAMAEEATAACHSLKVEADVLTENIDHFSVGGVSGAARPVAVAPAEQATAHSRSPANELISKVKNAYTGGANGNLAVAAEEEWEEF